MKNILKIFLFIFIGLVIGSVATGLLLNKFHRRYLAEIYAMDVGANALTAEMLHDGNAEIVEKSFENSLPAGVLGITAGSERRNANMADTALSAVKRFYVCTNTAIPPEIAEIMETVTAMPCAGPE